MSTITICLMREQILLRQHCAITKSWGTISYVSSRRDLKFMTKFTIDAAARILLAFNFSEKKFSFFRSKTEHFFGGCNETDERQSQYYSFGGERFGTDGFVHNVCARSRPRAR